MANNKLLPLLALLLAVILLDLNAQVTGQRVASMALRPAVDLDQGSYDYFDDDDDDMDEMADMRMPDEEMAMAVAVLNTGGNLMEIAQKMNVSDADMADMGLDSMKITGGECKLPEKECVSVSGFKRGSREFWPRCVLLQRCPAECGCVGEYMSCLPTATRNVTVQLVRNTALVQLMMGRGKRDRTSTYELSAHSGASGARRSSRLRKSQSTRNSQTMRGRAGGRRRGRMSRRNSRRSRPSRDPKTPTVAVELEEHTQCACRCHNKDCDMALHVFSTRDCSCVCKNNSDERSCRTLEEVGTHYWDNRKCACYCIFTTSCGNGLTFSQDTCNCIPDGLAGNPSDYI